MTVFALSTNEIMPSTVSSPPFIALPYVIYASIDRNFKNNLRESRARAITVPQLTIYIIEI